ncbi:MAG: hypothetical protein K5871_12365 [Lachnospiraceae bacterium]|nr:hypothetical protein [Lachnospiraceae bacterium]
MTYLAIAAITNMILHDYYAHMTDASYVAIRVLNNNTADEIADIFLKLLKEGRIV